MNGDPERPRPSPAEGSRAAELAFMTEVAQPVLVKAGELFLVGRPDGSLATEACGLFYRDCRYLSRYDVALGDAPTMVMMSSSARGGSAVIELANGRYEVDGRVVDMQSLGLRWERVLAAERPALFERLVIRNFSPDPVTAPLRLTLRAGFEDLFELRGRPRGRRGRLHAPELGGDQVLFRYDGADGVTRRLAVLFSRAPELDCEADGEVTAAFRLELGPEEAQELSLAFSLAEGEADGRAPDLEPAEDAAPPAFECDGARVTLAMTRSLADLRMLKSGRERPYFAGGLPWFVALFGRDSILSAVQALPFHPEVAAGTARALAGLQGRKEDPETGEQPGKIPHEYRVGETARLGEVPFGPGYQSVDSTPLFLILVGLHARWTGELSLFHELAGPVAAALEWMRTWGDADGDGYLDYAGTTPEGFLLNQAWKDSSAAMVRVDGSAPEPPIAPVEVQGYAYKARRLIADLYRRAGDEARAGALEAEAEALRERFERDFWMEGERIYCLALERGGRQVRAVTSNGAQVLWSGLAGPERAAQVAARVMQEDLFCGWGVRTLSSRGRGYNPFHYHLGSVWPFDNSLIAAGLFDYGLAEPGRRVVEGVLDAAACFQEGRLPEFFVGLPREPGLYPGRCPFADPVQAWSAGAAPYMLTSMLGLRADGFERTLRAVNPVLPEGVGRLRLSLQFAGTTAECRFERTAGGVVFRGEGEGIRFVQEG